MKKNYPLILLVIVVVFGVSSCDSFAYNEEEPDKPVSVLPSLSVDTEEFIFTDEGGELQLSFKCNKSWSLSTDASWLSVSKTSGAAGDITLGLIASSNFSYDERNTVLTIKCDTISKSIKVTQKQHDAILVSSDKVEINAEGGDISIEVKTNVSFSYEIDDDAKSWISDAETRALASSVVGLHILENDSLSVREGKILFTDGKIKEVVTIYQQGSVPSLVLTKTDFDIDCLGDTVLVELKSNSDYSIEMPSVDWIHDLSSRAFTTYTHKFIVDENESFEDRSCTIGFKNLKNDSIEYVHINQKKSVPNLILSEKNYSVSSKRDTICVQLRSNSDYSISIADDTWIHELSSRGMNNYSHYFIIDENKSYADRSNEIHFTNLANDSIDTVSVYQKQNDAIVLAQNEYKLSYSATTLDISVDSNIDYSVDIYADWISRSETRSLKSSKLSFNISENTSSVSRTGYILVKGGGIEKQITVIQGFKQNYYVKVDKTAFNLKSDASKINITVDANVGYKVAVTKGAEWISQVASTDSNILSFSVAENKTQNDRTGEISIINKVTADTIKVSVHQDEIPVIKVSKTEYQLTAKAQHLDFDFEINEDFSIEISGSWIKRVTSRTMSTKHLYFDISENKSSETRTGYIYIVGSRSSRTIRVVQSN